MPRARSESPSSHAPTIALPSVRRRHQIHRQTSIVPTNHQPLVSNRPVPLTAGAARGKRPVAPKDHRPVVVAHAVILEPPTIHRRDRRTIRVRRQRLGRGRPRGLQFADEPDALGLKLKTRRLWILAHGPLPPVAMLKDAVALEIMLAHRARQRVDAAARHGVFLPQLPPAQVEQFLVAVDVLEEEGRPFPTGCVAPAA